MSEISTFTSGSLSQPTIQAYVKMSHSYRLPDKSIKIVTGDMDNFNKGSLPPILQPRGLSVE